jgi:hypothetical protein
LSLGYKPGPLVGKILAAVEEAQLNGELASREDAISFVGSKFGTQSEKLGKAS